MFNKKNTTEQGVLVLEALVATLQDLEATLSRIEKKLDVVYDTYKSINP